MEQTLEILVFILIIAFIIWLILRYFPSWDSQKYNESMSLHTPKDWVRTICIVYDSEEQPVLSDYYEKCIERAGYTIESRKVITDVMKKVILYWCSYEGETPPKIKY